MILNLTDFLPNVVSLKEIHIQADLEYPNGLELFILSLDVEYSDTRQLPMGAGHCPWGEFTD